MPYQLVPIEILDRYVRDIILKVNHGQFLAYKEGVQNYLPDNIQFEVMVSFIPQAISIDTTDNSSGFENATGGTNESQQATDQTVEFGTTYSTQNRVGTVQESGANVTQRNLITTSNINGTDTNMSSRTTVRTPALTTTDNSSQLTTHGETNNQNSQDNYTLQNDAGQSIPS